LLNLVADVLPDGQYVSTIDDPDQVSHPTHSPLLSLSHTYQEREKLLRKASQFAACVLYFYSCFQINKVSYLQRFAAFLSPLTLGRVNIAVSSVYISKVCLATFLFCKYVEILPYFSLRFPEV
jgi:hypothetical protein